MNGRLEPCQSQNAITESKNQAVSEWKLVSTSDASCSHCSSSWSWNVYVTWIDGIPAKILKALVAQSVNAGLTTLRSLVRIQPVTGRAHYKLYKCSFLGSWALWECLSDSLSHIYVYIYIYIYNHNHLFINPLSCPLILLEVSKWPSPGHFWHFATNFWYRSVTLTETNLKFGQL